jgi:hypothetical protein
MKKKFFQAVKKKLRSRAHYFWYDLSNNKIVNMPDESLKQERNASCDAFNLLYSISILLILLELKHDHLRSLVA